MVALLLGAPVPPPPDPPEEGLTYSIVPPLVNPEPGGCPAPFPPPAASYVEKLETEPAEPDVSKTGGFVQTAPLPPAPTLIGINELLVTFIESMSRRPPAPPPAPTHAPPPPPPPTIKTRTEDIPVGTVQLHVPVVANLTIVYPPVDISVGKQAGIVLYVIENAVLAFVLFPDISCTAFAAILNVAVPDELAVGVKTAVNCLLLTSVKLESEPPVTVTSPTTKL